MITKFKHFNMLNENIKLTDSEKEYLWKKIEYTKKKKAEAEQNSIYNLLKGSKSSMSNDDFDHILKSLEYTFRKKLSGQDANQPKSDDFQSIFNKIPKAWIGVKFSSLKAKQNKDNKIPTEKNSKDDIKKYLTKQNIKFDDKLTKKELVKLIK